MPIRGTRSIWPPKREKAGEMFTGADASQPHPKLQKKALKPHNNVGGMKNTVGGTSGQSDLRHQKHYGRSH